MNKTKPSILITGCSSGIGYATAILLRNNGWLVYATARNLMDVHQLQAEGFDSWQLDIADSWSIHNTVRILEERNGCSALFANAGFGVPGAIEDLSREAWREQFETNVFGTAELVGNLSGMMVLQGSGKIIINSSVLGYVGLPLRGAYVASKFALEGMADTLRLELKGTGVEVGLLEPGPVLANFRKNSLVMLKKHIAVSDSRHASSYTKMITRLETEGSAVPFTVSAEETARVVFSMLRAKKMPIRKQVTVPAKLNWWLKHILPARLMDKILGAGPA